MAPDRLVGGPVNSLRGYVLPTLLALVLHAAVGASLMANWRSAPAMQRDPVRPPIIQAQLLVMEAPEVQARPDPVAQARAQQAERERQVAAQREAERREAERREAERRQAERQEAERREAQRREAERQEAERREAERRAAEERAAAERERQRREAEARAERERDERRRDQAESSFDRALSAEAERLAGDERQQQVQSFSSAIYQQIYRNWSRPPSARTGMETLLRVELVPTGEVVSVTVVRSSGNATFDRSAEQAVRRASPLEVPRDTRLFENHFRRIDVLFNPQDLIR